MRNDVRVIFKGVSEGPSEYEDAVEDQDLHVTITHEGVIYDLVGQTTGDVAATKSMMAEEIADEELA
jgi:hypothetical protein